MKSPARPSLPRHLFRLPGNWAVLAAFAVFCAASDQPARAQADSQAVVGDHGRQQIAAIQHDHELRTPAQRKIGSSLLYSFRQSVSGTAVSGVPSLRSTLAAEPDGRYKVKLTADVSDKLLAAIGALGGKVLNSFPAYRVVYALMPLATLETLAQRTDVQFIGVPPKAVLRDNGRATSESTPHANHVPAPEPQATETAVNDPEGDATHGAKAVRTQYGVTGAGVKVGVISDSLNDSSNSYQTAVNKGYVSTVTVIPGQSGGIGEGEGLAMLEIVHRLAPGAQLYFATGFNSEQDMADSIKTMQADGCRVIIDDIGYDDENPFQDDVISLAVVDVTAKGVLYFSAGGNSGNLDSGMSSCWEGDFKSTSTQGDGFLDFNAGTGKGALEKNLVLGADVDIELFWSEPEGSVTSQYNLYEFDPADNVVQVASDDVTQTERPFQSFNVTAGDRVVVQLASGVARFLHLDTASDSATFFAATAGHARGHNALDAAGSFCVAATPASVSQDDTPNGPYPNEFNSSNSVEDFSDDGPRRMFFKPDGSAYTPGNFTSTGGKVFARPSFTAADGVTTSVPAIGGDGNPFFGTSAAAPHAGALAALAFSYRAGLTQAQVAHALVYGTVQIKYPGPGNRDAGTGILLAPNIFKQLPAAAAPVITSAKTASGTVGVAFSYRIAATNNPTSFGFQGNANGLSINASTGVISGTPKAAGTFAYTLNAYNSAGKGSETLTVTIAAH